MESIRTEKKKVSGTNLVTHQNDSNNGKSMPAVPALQKQHIQGRDSSMLKLPNGVNTVALQRRTLDGPLQFRKHKPTVGSQVRYPATGPGQGAVYNVSAVADDGSLTIQAGQNTHNISWKTDNIWLIRVADNKDIDSRQEHGAWALLSKPQKALVYAAAKDDAVTLLKTYIKPGMINKTNRDNLEANLTFGFFNKKKKGEWIAIWTEPTPTPRKWQLTIDMDNPLETSSQEPHVGWEVKLIDKGAKGNGDAYDDFAKGQGHVWLNEVPEAR